MLVLIITAVASATPVGRTSISTRALRAHGGTTPQAFSESLYALFIGPLEQSLTQHLA